MDTVRDSVVDGVVDLVKVLVIDADEVFRKAILKHLLESGYQTVEAASVESGLELMESEAPELVLFDLHGSQIEGVDVLKVIANKYSHIPIIIISDADVMSEVVSALRLGVSDYLMKPINDLEVLEHAIERSLERFSLRRENLKYRQQLEKVNADLKEYLSVLEQDQQAGLQVQMKMLPASPMQKGAYVFHHQIIPSLFLSGDFVDYVTVGADHVVFFSADVSGHGASSAFVTVLLKNLIARLRSDRNHHISDDILHPEKFLKKANEELLATGIGKHATMFYAVLNTQDNTLTYSVAGQLPLPILVEKKQASYLEGQGAPVGLFEEATYVEHTVELSNKFRLLMFSDGILEVMPEKTLAKKEAAILELAPELRSSIPEVLESFGIESDSSYPDDIALFIVDRV